MKVILWFAAILVMFGAVTSFQLMHFQLPESLDDSVSTHIVALGGAKVNVVLARTRTEIEQGLSGRDPLARNEGMLFVFDKDDTYAFWMKDMKFSIDIIWLAVNGTVVDLAENVSPSTYPQSFRPKVPARFVLEVPAGFAREYMVRVGDVAKLP